MIFRNQDANRHDLDELSNQRPLIRRQVTRQAGGVRSNEVKIRIQ